MEERQNVLPCKKDMCDIINRYTEERKGILNENIIEKLFLFTFRETRQHDSEIM